MLFFQFAFEFNATLVTLNILQVQMCSSESKVFLALAIISCTLVIYDGWYRYSLVENEALSRAAFINGVREQYYRERLFGTPNMKYRWIRDPREVAAMLLANKVAEGTKLADAMLRSYYLDTVDGPVFAEDRLSNDPCDINATTLANVWFPRNKRQFWGTWCFDAMPEKCDAGDLLERLDKVSFARLMLLAAVLDFRDFSMENIAILAGGDGKLDLKLIVRRLDGTVNNQFFQQFDKQWLRSACDHSSRDIWRTIQNLRHYLPDFNLTIEDVRRRVGTNLDVIMS